MNEQLSIQSKSNKQYVALQFIRFPIGNINHVLLLYLMMKINDCCSIKFSLAVLLKRCRKSPLKRWKGREDNKDNWSNCYKMRLRESNIIVEFYPNSKLFPVLLLFRFLFFFSRAPRAKDSLSPLSRKGKKQLEWYVGHCQWKISSLHKISNYS